MDILKYIEDPVNFELDFAYKNALHAQTDDLSRVIYTDTDSSFTLLFQLIQIIIESEYEVGSDDFEYMIKKFEEPMFTKGFTRNDIIEIIQDLSKNLETFINENVLRKYGHLHNISDEYNVLDFKQEYIFSSIYLVQVKHYVYRAIAEKGRMVDDFDYLNIGIKSDKADVVNTIIQSLTKIFLTHSPAESIPYAINFINQIKGAISSGKLFIPASLSKPLTEYNTNIEKPRGAAIYEIITDQEGIFVGGVKGKLFKVTYFNWSLIPNAEQKQKKIETYFREKLKIKGNIRDYINVIVIPESDDRFNYDWFTIDEESQLIKILLKPLQQIYGPVGIDVAEFAKIDKRKLK